MDDRHPAQKRYPAELKDQAEQVTDDAELQPVATAFAIKYPTGPWDFVARDGASDEPRCRSDPAAVLGGVPDIQGWTSTAS